MYGVSHIVLVVTCVIVFGFVFFQAEDGIRDLVRSRGLGDVYKRQGLELAAVRELDGHLLRAVHDVGVGEDDAVRADDEPGTLAAHRRAAVSYTHLTLPTSDLV